MADTERSERPTARKLRRARMRGDVAQSPLASAALVLSAFTTTISLGGSAAVAAWCELVRELWVTDPPGGREAATRALDAGVPLLLLLAVLVVSGVLGSFLQVGPLWTARPLTPDLSRLHRGWAAFVSPAALTTRLGALSLAIGVAAIGLWAGLQALPGLLGRSGATAAWLLSAGGTVLLRFAWPACTLLLVAAAGGVAYRRWRWWRQQHMTRRERREEWRETEGEPALRHRRAAIHRERAMVLPEDEALRRASLVVRGSNIAVVLEWSNADASPRVIMVARGGSALRVGRADVPSMIDSALAVRLASRPLGPVERALWRPLARHFARAERGG